MPWAKGKSGNPTGRPKVDPEVRELALRNGPKAFRKICKLIDSDDERIALAASQYVCDRAWGKAVQAVEVSGDIEHYVIIAPTTENTLEEWQQKYQPLPQIVEVQATK